MALLLSSSAASDEVASPGPHSDDVTPLQSILARFAAMPGFSAEFREEKRIALLRDPLVSHGSIYFAPPDRLARYVTTPVPSVMLLIGDRVSYDFKGNRGSLDINSHPVFRGLASGFRLLLAGDAEGLERVFDAKAEVAESGRWSIVLRPRQESLRESIESMRVSGTDGRLDELQIGERNGDEATTQFSKVQIAREFSASETKQFFRLPDS